MMLSNLQTLFHISGIFTAAFDNQIEWLIVKSIADYAGGAAVTKGNWFPCASVMAASLVAHILSDPGVFCSWPHYAGIDGHKMFAIYFSKNISAS